MISFGVLAKETGLLRASIKKRVVFQKKKADSGYIWISPLFHITLYFLFAAGLSLREAVLVLWYFWLGMEEPQIT